MKMIEKVKDDIIDSFIESEYPARQCLCELIGLQVLTKPVKVKKNIL